MSGPVFAVLGAGMQGRCAAHDLLVAGAGEVRLVDVDPAVAEQSAARVAATSGRDNVRAMAGDARDVASLTPALRGADAVLSALPYFLNPPVAAACVEAGASYCDLGGNTGVSARVHALDAQARARGVALVPDCGLAPGLANTLAAAAIDRLDDVTDVYLYCGGLPVDPAPPFNYQLVFAIDGLINEYDGEADVLVGGEPARVRTLDDTTLIDFPGLGRLEAFPTSGGTSTAPDTFRGRLRTFEYRTLRYPGHIAYFRAYREAGLFSEAPIDVRGTRVVPREVLKALLAPRLVSPGSRDLVALMVVAHGKRDGRPVAGVWRLLDRHDERTGYTAMERGTAFPAAVVCWMLATGETPKGALRLERDVPPERFLEHLSRRDLPLVWEIRER